MLSVCRSRRPSPVCEQGPCMLLGGALSIDSVAIGAICNFNKSSSMLERLPQSEQRRRSQPTPQSYAAPRYLILRLATSTAVGAQTMHAAVH